MNYEIISSGSVGNAVKLTLPNGVKMMIDCGISYKTLKTHMEDVQILFVSHRHADHLNMGAYNQTCKNFPWIKRIGNTDVNQTVISKRKKPLHYVVDAGQTIVVEGVKLHFICSPHDDTPNLGLIGECDDFTFLYATDLNTTYHYEEFLREHGLKIDLLLLEANYNPDVVYFMEKLKLHSGYDIFGNGSFRHLSTRENQAFADEFLKTNGTSVHLHTSATYYSYEGLKEKLELGDEYDEIWRSTQER